MTIQACISFQFPDQFHFQSVNVKQSCTFFFFKKKGEQQDRQLREREESLLFFFSLSLFPPDCWCGLLSIGNMCWPYVRKRSALPAHHSLRISAGVYRRRHTNMAYYIYKRGRKGRCSFLCSRWPTYKRPRVSVLFFIFLSLPHFLFLVLFFSCSSSSTCVLLLLQAMFSITVNTGRANNSVRAFRLEKDILFHSYMPNIRALSWPLKCYLTGRFDGARRGLERNLWTSESMGRKKTKPEEEEAEEGRNEENKENS